MTNRTVAVDLIAKVQGYKAGLASATASTKDFRSELDGMRKNSGTQFNQMAAGVGVVGVAMAGLVGWAVKLGMEFDKAMSEVHAITNASVQDMGALRKAALDAGKDTVFTAREAAQAEAELAKAGVSTADILGGGLKGALSLAAAGTMEVAEAAEIAAKTMGQFGLAGKDVPRIADLLAGAANASATDVHGLGEALKMGGLAAHAAGVNLEDTTTVFTAFAKSALVGSDAGTSFKTMMMMLQAPTDKASHAMQDYGLSVYDAEGNMVDVYTLAERLQKSFGGLTMEQRNAAFATIFGADAMRAANVMYQQGSTGLRGLNKEMLAQADAARVAGQKTDNLAGDMERLKGSLESAMIAAQDGSTGPLRFLAQTVDSLIGSFSELPSWIQQSVFILAGATAAALLGAVAYLKLRGTVRDVMEAMRLAGPMSGRFADGLGRVGGAAGKAGFALAALAATAAVATALDEWSVDADGLATSLERLGKTGKVSGELTRQFGDDLSGLGDALNSADNPFSAGLKGAEALVPGLRQMNREWLNGSPTDYAEQLKMVDATLAGMVKNGNADAARAAVFHAMQDTGRSYDEILAKLPQYKNANDEANKSTKEQADAAKKATAANMALGGGFAEAASKAESLMGVFKELNGIELTNREATRNAEAAVDDLAEALKESNGLLDDHTKEGRNAGEALDNLAKRGVEAAQAEYQHSNSVESANAVYQNYVATMREMLLRTGMAEEKVDALVLSIMKMPAYTPIVIDVDIRQNRSTNLIDLAHDAGERNRWGGLYTHAADGLLSKAAMFSGGPTRYAFAEEETGGEAFIPRKGEYDRSMAILSGAAKWYGADVVPQGGGGGGPTTVNAYFTLDGQVIEKRVMQIGDARDRATNRRVRSGPR